MSYPVYTVPFGDVLPVLFDTFDGGTGASITLTGLATSDIEIYKDGSATQRASDAGYTLLDTDGIDFDGITGIHGFSIDTGDNTDPGFYTVGSWYHVVVSSVTVDGQTVNFIACAFRIMAAESVAGVPNVNTTHISGTAQTANDVGADVNDILTDTAEIGVAGAGLTAINLPDQTMNITGNITGNLSGSVGSVTGAVGSVIGNVGGDVQGNVNGSVASIATGGIAAASFAAGAIDASAIAANAIGTSEVATAVDARIADAIWDEARSGHTTQGTYGESQSKIISGAAIAGTLSTTQMTTDLTNATDDALNGRSLIFEGNVTAALAGQATTISDYVGATKLITMVAVTTAPAAGDRFQVV